MYGSDKRKGRMEERNEDRKDKLKGLERNREEGFKKIKGILKEERRHGIKI
jgi:hypothetical protein